MNNVLLICQDLIFVTKITGTARGLGRTINVQAGPPASADIDAELVLVDLNCAGTASDSLRHLREIFPAPSKLVAFGSHVDVDRLREARAAGFDHVMPRSEFTQKLTQLLGTNEKG